jgi:hypothetical protein
VPKVCVKCDSDGPETGDLGSNDAPGRGRTKMASDILLSISCFVVKIEDGSREKFEMWNLEVCRY